MLLEAINWFACSGELTHKVMRIADYENNAEDQILTGCYEGIDKWIGS